MTTWLTKICEVHKEREAIVSYCIHVLDGTAKHLVFMDRSYDLYCKDCHSELVKYKGKMDLKEICRCCVYEKWF